MFRAPSKDFIPANQLQKVARLALAILLKFVPQERKVNTFY
jgi:hypothetical protein